MTLGDVERQLRAGPPEEQEYRVRPLVLDSGVGATTDTRTAAARLLPAALGGLRLLAGGAVLAALLVAAFQAGRLSSDMAGVAAPPASVGLQAAFVPQDLRQAYYSGPDRQKDWLVCTRTEMLRCSDVLAYRTVDALGDDVWSHLQPVTVSARHVIVGAGLDPTKPVEAYVSPADDPSGSGSQLTAVSTQLGNTFIDLGELAPGRYVLSVLNNPSSPIMCCQTAIGIIVQ